MAARSSRDSGDPLLPRVGISTCLLGERVRYDGGHKRDDRLLARLEGVVELLPVCPESELGLGVPREPIGLAGDPEDPRLLGLETGKDLTERMKDFCRKRAEEIRKIGIHGFILKARSPSCGLGGLEIDLGGGRRVRSGVGFWARALREVFPGLPMAEAEDLGAPGALERFLGRVKGFLRSGGGGRGEDR